MPGSSGPAIGGLIFVALGDGFDPVALCFFINAATYAAVLCALALMRPSELHRRPSGRAGQGTVRAGLRYAWSTPDPGPSLVVAVVGLFAFNFTVILPLFAQ